MSCQERSGFLFAHDCDRAAVWNCSVCGKSICGEHTRMGDAGPTCIGCLRTTMAQQQEQQQQQQNQQGTSDTDTTDDPYLYSDDDYYSTSYYDADDYGAFEASADASDSGPEGDLGAS